MDTSGNELSQEFMQKAEFCYKKPTMDEFDICVKGLTKLHEATTREFSLRGQYIANKFSICLRGGDDLDSCLGDAKKNLSVVVRDLKAMF